MTTELPLFLNNYRRPYISQTHYQGPIIFSKQSKIIHKLLIRILI